MTSMKESNERFTKAYSRRAKAEQYADMSNAEIRKQLYRLCEEFIEGNQISCPEAIWQMDHVIGNAYEFIEEMCNLIGYASVGEEGADDDQ